MPCVTKTLYGPKKSSSTSSGTSPSGTSGGASSSPSSTGLPGSNTTITLPGGVVVTETQLAIGVASLGALAIGLSQGSTKGGK